MIRELSREQGPVIALLSHSLGPAMILQHVGERSRRKAPDLHLIKQVEQVTRSVLERPAQWSRQCSEQGITHAVEVPVFLIRQLLDWLLCGCRNSQEGVRGRLFAKRQGRCKGAEACRPSN